MRGRGASNRSSVARRTPPKLTLASFARCLRCACALDRTLPSALRIDFTQTVHGAQDRTSQPEYRLGGVFEANERAKVTGGNIARAVCSSRPRSTSESRWALLWSMSRCASSRRAGSGKRSSLRCALRASKRAARCRAPQSRSGGPSRTRRALITCAIFAAFCRIARFARVFICEKPRANRPHVPSLCSSAAQFARTPQLTHHASLLAPGPYLAMFPFL